MKKDRNSFFSNYTSQYQSFTPNMIPNQMPYIDNNLYANNISSNNELENRISKIERQLNRLEQRISNLETNTHNTPQNITTQINDQNYQNMYMI